MLKHLIKFLIVYIGQPLSEAIAALEGAGLSYEISGAVSGDDYANYSITGYTQEVKKNEPVKLKAKKDITGGTTELLLVIQQLEQIMMTQLLQKILKLQVMIYLVIP